MTSSIVAALVFTLATSSAAPSTPTPESPPPQPNHRVFAVVGATAGAVLGAVGGAAAFVAIPDTASSARWLANPVTGLMAGAAVGAALGGADPIGIAAAAVGGPVAVVTVGPGIGFVTFMATYLAALTFGPATIGVDPAEGGDLSSRVTGNACLAACGALGIVAVVGSAVGAGATGLLPRATREVPPPAAAAPAPAPPAADAVVDEEPAPAAPSPTVEPPVLPVPTAPLIDL